MTTTTRPQKNESDDDPRPGTLASDEFFLGVDGEGEEHYFSRIYWTVWVFDGDELVRRQDVRERLEDWVKFVDERRGWDECHYRLEGSLIDRFADIVAEHGLGEGDDEQ